jgi:hypothetical protein
MGEKPKLSCTRNYDIFEMHDHNRPLHDDPGLLASMQKRGFMPSSPIHCERNGSGKLKVKRGHHRLDYAQRLGLPVWYVVDDTDIDIFELEGGRQAWTASDFLAARTAAGNSDCAKVQEFRKRHGLTIGVAASLMGGQSAGSGNMVRAIKNGTFRVAQDLSHAYAVVDVVSYCKTCGVDFATGAAFVSAVSMVLRVPEFDVAVFKHRVKLHGSNMHRRNTKEDYVDEIDAIYNYGAKAMRLPVAFRAREISRERSKHFGVKARKRGKR